MCRASFKGYEYNNASFLAYPCPTMEYVIVRTNDEDDAPCIVGRTLEAGETMSEYADRLMDVDGMHVIVLCEQVPFSTAQEMVARHVNAFKGFEDVLKKDKPEVKSGVIGPGNCVNNRRKKNDRKVIGELWKTVLKLVYVLSLVVILFVFTYLFSCS